MQNKCIRINQIKLPINHTEKELEEKIQKLLKLKKESIIKYEIVKKSVDARKKPDIRFVYSVDVYLKNYNKIDKKIFNRDIILTDCIKYHYEITGKQSIHNRPVIVGLGPAGLFCGYYLAKNGYQPILIERGEDVDSRKISVDLFWETGKLNTESNVQFGEGGAGTFSDGKLNTLVRDKSGRNREVLDTFIEFGADEEIRYAGKPHIGTDVIREVVKNMRKEICRLGGEVRFHTKLTDICMAETDDESHEKRVTGIIVNQAEKIETEILVLAIGHSARDTFEMLYEKGIDMSAKSFAVGLRIEHPQSMINRAMYGVDMHELLEAADYKVTYKTQERGIYSFCMCPGGYVINASSEEGRLAVNGMSYSSRSGENSNSAIVAAVSPDDYGRETPLDGMKFQRKLEERAFCEGKGRIPVQCFGDFCDNKITKAFKGVYPAVKGEFYTGNLRNVLGDELSEQFAEAIHSFAKQIPQFDREDAVLSGVESRTSSPVRIERNERFCSTNLSGLYPCGEGAGYAGGITSAAMDGIRIFEAVIKKYKPFCQKRERILE